ncbi:MbcA/ParS/Xre antitoxin family protein [Kiloniella sp.]|uniref:MbcA/ParS/Xre antitoxin family protein n=1 Tax=Kiloniella sp. TaxID=1938587 RepID=UPI003A91F22F
MICVLFDKWGLTEQEGCEILGCTLGEYQVLKTGEDEGVEAKVKERITEVSRINKGLRLLFKDPKRGEAWVKKPNKAFEGRSAFEIMKSDLVRVRKYLEAELW